MTPPSQLKVLPRDLQLCSETASGVDAGGQHEWGELVQLDPQTVGVIVRLERETFQVRAEATGPPPTEVKGGVQTRVFVCGAPQVLNMHGKVMTVRHQAVNRRKDNRFAVALDSEQNNIHVKDIVKVIDGPHSVRTAELSLQRATPQPVEYQRMYPFQSKSPAPLWKRNPDEK